MSEPLVLYSVEDGLATLELNHPPANCYTYDLMRELDARVLEARMDPTVGVLLLRGRGDRFFCAGADIGMLNQASPDFKYAFCLHANETLQRLEQTPKLVIAALNGHCVGGGLEIALAADLRVARRGGGRMGLPEIHLGVLPGTGGTQRLARLLGRTRALELMLSGRNFSFEEGEALGLIQALLEPEDFEAGSAAYARQFLPPGKAGMAVGRIKRAVQSGLEVPLHEGLALERELQQQLFQSQDAAEGLSAYLEKRSPQFRGR